MEGHVRESSSLKSPVSAGRVGEGLSMRAGGSYLLDIFANLLKYHKKFQLVNVMESIS